MKKFLVVTALSCFLNLCVPNLLSQVAAGPSFKGFLTTPSLLTGSDNEIYAVALGDLNGDGKEDLVATFPCFDFDEQCPHDQESYVIVMLNNGKAGFGKPVQYKLGLGSNGNESIAIGDFNGDGNLDIAAVSECVGKNCSAGENGIVSILLGNGDGTFAAPILTAVSEIPEYRGLTLGDFNNDGKLDLAFTAFDYVTVLLGNGDGTFQPAADYATDDGSIAIVAGDLNGDGTLDLVTANQNSSNVSVLIGNGDGTFQPAVNYLAPATVWFGLALVDFNLDGNLDIAITTSSSSGAGSLYVLYGNGQGSFQPPVLVANIFSPQTLVTGDFNQDGNPDFAVTGDLSGSVEVLLGNGKGGVLRQQQYLTEPEALALAVGDLNGDGKQDLVAGSTTANDPAKNISPLLGLDNGSFIAEPSFNVDVNPRGIAAGVFNNDGLPSLAVTAGCLDSTACSTGAVDILLGQKGGGFEPYVSYPEGGNPTQILVADFDQNGVDDLAVLDIGESGYNAHLDIFLGNGNGTFSNELLTNLPPNPETMAIADVNNDGLPDVIIGGENYVNVYLGNGNGTFMNPLLIPVPAYGIALADLNGDGNLDLAVSDGASTITIYLGNGNGTFNELTSYTAGSNTLGLTLAQLTSDGNADLIASDGTSQLRVFLGNGNGTFNSPTTYTGGDGSPVSVADVNSDGFPDLVFAGALTSYGANVMLGNGNGTFAQTLRYGSTYGVVFVYDLTGNGRPDVAVTNFGTGGSGQGATVDILLNLQ